MKKKKTHEEVCYEFEKFKREFYDLFYLIKLLNYETINFLETKDYINDDEYLTQNCLFSLSSMIDVLLDRNVKKIEQLYFEFEFK